MGKTVYGAINNIGGGEVWEEVDHSNFPTDWVAGDVVKITCSYYIVASCTSWTSSITIQEGTNSTSDKIEFELMDSAYSLAKPYFLAASGSSCSGIGLTSILTIFSVSNWNSGSNLFDISGIVFNGSYSNRRDNTVTRKNISQYVPKMWRLKK